MSEIMSVNPDTMKKWISNDALYETELLTFMSKHLEGSIEPLPSIDTVTILLDYDDTTSNSVSVYFAQLSYHTVYHELLQKGVKITSDSTSLLGSMVLCKNPRKKRLHTYDHLYPPAVIESSSSSSSPPPPLLAADRRQQQQQDEEERPRKIAKTKHLVGGKMVKIRKIHQFGCRLLPPLLMFPQERAADLLNMSASKLSRKFSEAIKTAGKPTHDEDGSLLIRGRKWPHRSLVRVDKAIRNILLRNGLATEETLPSVFARLIQNRGVLFAEDSKKFEESCTSRADFDQLRKYINYRMDVLFSPVIVQFSSAIPPPPGISRDYIEVLGMTYSYGSSVCDATAVQLQMNSCDSRHPLSLMDTK
jgi:hypothetical protein